MKRVRSAVPFVLLFHCFAHGTLRKEDNTTRMFL